MTEDAVTKYLDAQNRYEKVQTEIQGMQTHIKEVSDALLSCFNFRIPNVTMPIEVGVGRGTYTFEPKKWPDADRITNSILALHETHQEAIKAWSAIPEQYKSNLKPPRPI